MRKFIFRIISLLRRLGIIKKVITVRHEGKGLSINQFYLQGHWKRRSDLKNEFKGIFEALFAKHEELEWMDEFMLILFFNCRMDTDNTSGMIKIFVDTMKGRFIANDTKKHFPSTAMVYDPELPINTYEFVLLKLK